VSFGRWRDASALAHEVLDAIPAPAPRAVQAPARCRGRRPVASLPDVTLTDRRRWSRVIFRNGFRGLFSSCICIFRGLFVA
jgi:hypothetical protein